MVNGLYSAASGMFAQQLRQEAIANNIANVSTVGYKKAIPALKGFHQIYLEALRGGFVERGDVPGGGVLMDATATDFSQGIIEHTGEGLDAALVGPGFFVVQNPAGTNLYTRNGHFTLNDAGELVTESGFRVLGEGGAIRVAGARVTITEGGQVVADGRVRGTLRIVTFDDPRVLYRVGDTLFGALEDAAPALAEDAKVVPESLEISNVSVAREMINMTMVARNFEANTRVIRAIDQILDRTVNEVSRV